MDASRSGPLLRLEQVSKIYPTGEVLRNVTWEVKPGDRIGLVGVNGAGKSTQMRLIAGFEEPSSGQVVRQGSPRIAYLQQEFDVDLERSVREELFQAFGEAATVLNRQREVEEEMGSEKQPTIQPISMSSSMSSDGSKAALRAYTATNSMLALTNCCRPLALALLVPSDR